MTRLCAWIDTHCTTHLSNALVYALGFVGLMSLVAGLLWGIGWLTGGT